MREGQRGKWEGGMEREKDRERMKVRVRVDRVDERIAIIFPCCSVHNNQKYISKENQKPLH